MFSRRPGARFNRGRVPTTAPANTLGGWTARTIAVASDGYGDQRTNAVIFSNPLAYDFARDREVIGFYNQAQAITLYSGPIGGPYVRTVTGITSTFVEDAHNIIAASIDPTTGHLFVSANMHSDPLNFWEASSDSDVSLPAWETRPCFPSSGALEDSDTYPHFMLRPDLTDLIFHCRSGVSGDGDLYRVRIEGATRVVEETQLCDGEGLRSFYPMTFFYANGRMHYAGCWRTAGGGYLSNHNYVYFYEEGGSYFKADGTAQTIPVTESNAGGLATSTNIGLQNTGSIAAFADGRPILASYTDRDGDGFSCHEIVYLDEEGAFQVVEWPPDYQRRDTRPMTLYNSTDGLTATFMSQIEIAHNPDTGVTVGVFRANGRGPGVWVFETQDPELQEVNLRQLTSDELEDWGPSYNRAIWAERRELHMLYQRVSATASIGQQPVSKLVLTPPTSVTYVAPTPFWDPDSISGCLFATTVRVGSLKVNGDTDSVANYRRVRDHEDERDRSAGFVQATIGDAPLYGETLWGGPSPGVRYTKAGAERCLITDATYLAALDGANLSFHWFIALEIVSMAANDTFISVADTADANHYWRLGVGVNGNELRLQRRSGAAGPVSVISAAGAIVTGTRYILEAWSDGAGNAATAINGVTAQTSSTWTSAGAITPDNGALGVLSRSTNADYGDFIFKQFRHYSTPKTGADRAVILAAMASDCGIAL